jgi:hypothetical protein
MEGKHRAEPTRADKHPFILWCCKYTWHILIELPTGLAAIFVGEKYLLPHILQSSENVHTFTQPPYWF